MNDDERFSRLSIDVLLVEDDTAFAELVERFLVDDREVEFKFTRAQTLADALVALDATPPQATLLDLGLPDSKGLATVRRFVEAAGDTALLILTAVEDQHLAQGSLSLGAQEYLVKDAVSPELLSRAIRYAVDRQGLINQLRTAREAESRERELRQVERLTNAPLLSATAAMYGNQSLAERAPERVAAMQAEYGRLLDEALEARVFDTQRPNRDDLRSMGGVLGYLGATPRDVVSIHAASLRTRMADAGYERSQAYLEEGRIMVLELMGYLVSWYRNRAMGATRQALDEGAAQ